MQQGCNDKRLWRSKLRCGSYLYTAIFTVEEGCASLNPFRTLYTARNMCILCSAMPTFVLKSMPYSVLLSIIDPSIPSFHPFPQSDSVTH
jgi:hypothetical protein